MTLAIKVKNTHLSAIEEIRPACEKVVSNSPLFYRLDVKSCRVFTYFYLRYNFSYTKEEDIFLTRFLIKFTRLLDRRVREDCYLSLK